MDRKKSRERRKRRIRNKIFGSSERPRLCVFRSLRGVYAQVVDDKKGKTLIAADFREIKSKNDIEGAKELGKFIAGKCVKLKITAVVFDRGGYKYHGKIKSFADGAREGGLKF